MKSFMSEDGQAQEREMYLNLHTAVAPYSFVNGPGLRAVIHVQGCSLGCKGCFNPASHDQGSGIRISVGDICASIPEQAEGVTISGGEPFQQPEGLLALVRLLRSQDFSILVFSGYTIEEIARQPIGPDILASIDVLIDGRFEANNLASSGLRGSNNQVIHLLTDRYRADELLNRQTELTFLEDGTATMTGFPSAPLRRSLP
ncbi:MAG: nrdG [Paenibacillus sp.]|jgi:anaerobic ribonucleoside-triphosphate reductase activating protein|nr:nrdG [Paenibacillus sp.]